MFFWKMVFLSHTSAHIAFFSEVCGPSAISRFSPKFAEKKNSLEYPDLVWNALNLKGCRLVSFCPNCLSELKDRQMRKITVNINKIYI